VFSSGASFGAGKRLVVTKTLQNHKGGEAVTTKKTATQDDTIIVIAAFVIVALIYIFGRYYL